MTIFISKDECDLGEIPIFLDSLNVNGIYRSLIQFEKVPFEFTASFEIIFFPSIRAAQFILDSKKIDLASYVLACSGAQTNQRLNQLGYHCEFVGENAGHPEEVSKKFSKWLGARKVLIPHSNLSSLSISKHIPQQQVWPLEVYRTVLSQDAVSHCDIYVFSSPSNIQSFFKNNKIKPSSKLIVWGQTSLKSLISHGYNTDLVLNEGTLNELKELLKQLIKTL